MAANSRTNKQGKKSLPGDFLKRAINLFGKEKKNSWYKEIFPSSYYKTYFQSPSRPVWMPREYEKFADEAYVKNVVAYRCISMISQSAASVPLKLSHGFGEDRIELKDHPVLRVISKPNPCCSGKEFFEKIYAYRMISGNAFLLSVRSQDGMPREIYALRPDRVSIVPGKDSIPSSYQYAVGKDVRNFPVDKITGDSDILHIKNFHPLNDWYGMSPIEAAAYSIDQHNQAGSWNQSLLQNGAKPSGALIVKANDDGSGGVLTDDQFTRIKDQVDTQYSGAANAGRPLLLEGGMEWKEMSLSPKDMDFIESKNSSARDIALAFGVPPQLLGIPGDNTYSNLVEARIALWEQTILPLVDNVANSLNNWLLPNFGKDLHFRYDTENISALAPKREKVWTRLEGADFMTINEKRHAVGLDPIEGGDKLFKE